MDVGRHLIILSLRASVCGYFLVVQLLLVGPCPGTDSPVLFQSSTDNPRSHQLL